MEQLSELLSPGLLVAALAIGFLAGVIKGIVGFAMPMVIISGLSIFLPPDVALAALILPTLLSNVWQSMRQGISAAWRSVVAVRIYLGTCLFVLVLSAQLVRVIPQTVLFLTIGILISLFTLLQLVGWQAQIKTRSRWIEVAVGSLAGFMGGLSGVWGPPTVAYLTAVNTPKTDQIRVQGTIYGLGSVALLAAHIQSGVMRAETWPLSVMMVVPAVLGMALGFRIQDLIDQSAFRRATLFVLLIAGLNLMRRGVMG